MPIKYKKRMPIEEGEKDKRLMREVNIKVSTHLWAALYKHHHDRPEAQADILAMRKRLSLQLVSLPAK